MAVNPKTEYFDEFRDLYCDGSAEQYILATLVDAGYSDKMEYAPGDPDFVGTMIRDGGDVSDFYFKHWIELHEEIWDNISTHVGDKPFLKRYICSMILAFKDVSAYYFPGVDADENQQEISNYLLAVACRHLPRTRELEQIAAPIVAGLKEASDFESLTPDEKQKRFASEIEPALKKYDEHIKSNIYEVTRLLYGMMEELAVHITACLLESGEKTSLFDYQRMCGVLLTDALYPFYLCRTMDWTQQYAESYMPEPLFYYPDSLKAKINSKPAPDPEEPLNGAVKCGVREIDELLEAGRKKVASYDEEKVERDLKTFRAVCLEKAKSSESIEQKTAWIVDILTVLTEVYYYNVHSEFAQYSYAARRFMIVLEAAFLRCAEKICVKNLYLELGMYEIIDFPYTSDPDAVVVPEPDPFNPPTTWGEHLLREEIGHSLNYHEKIRCSKCEVPECKYRFGKVELYKGLEAAGVYTVGEELFPDKPHAPTPAELGEKEYEEFLVNIDGEEEMIDSLNLIPVCGVKEIDRLFVQDLLTNSEYDENDFYPDLVSFGEKCKLLAGSNVPIKKKEAWIAAVLNVLLESYCAYSHTDKDRFVPFVIGFAAKMDAVFMFHPEQICVKRIAQEIGDPFIFEELSPKVTEEGEKNRIEMGLDPLPWEEDFLFEEYGPTYIYHQRSQCRDCSIQNCRFRFGRKRYYADVDYSFGMPETLPSQAQINVPAAEDVRQINGTAESFDYIEDCHNFICGRDVTAFLDAVSLELAIYPKWHNETSTKEEDLAFIKEHITPKSDYVYGRAEGLEAQLTAKVKSLKDDELELSNFIDSFLSPFYEVASTLFPLGKQESDKLRMVVFSCAEGYIHCSFADFKKLLADSTKSVIERSTDPDKDLTMEMVEEMLTRAPQNDIIPEDRIFAAIHEIMISLSYVEAALESALLKNGLPKDYIHYEEEAGVYLGRNITEVQIMLVSGLTPHSISARIQKYGHSTRHEIRPEEDTYDYVKRLYGGDSDEAEEELITPEKKELFNKALDNAISVFGTNYFKPPQDGIGLAEFQKTGALLAYIGRKLATMCDLEDVPWALILRKVKTTRDSNYLKGKCSKMKKTGRFPRGHEEVDSLVDTIKMD